MGYGAMSTRTIIEIILALLSVLGTSYFVYSRIHVRSTRRRTTVQDTKGVAASLETGHVSQAQDRGQIVQDHRQFFGNESTLVIYMSNPTFNLGSPVPDNLIKSLTQAISQVGHKHKVPQEKIKAAQNIVSDSAGSFGNLSTVILPVSGTFATASESSQADILSDILRLTDLEGYIDYQVHPAWKCQSCGHVNTFNQIACERCKTTK